MLKGRRVDVVVLVVGAAIVYGLTLLFQHLGWYAR